jgi:hypothetical protein
MSGCDAVRSELCRSRYVQMGGRTEGWTDMEIIGKNTLLMQRYNDMEVDGGREEETICREEETEEEETVEEETEEKRGL